MVLSMGSSVALGPGALRPRIEEIDVVKAIIRDLWLIFAYWGITAIAILVEVKGSAVTVSKWVFVFATLAFTVLVIANHFNVKIKNASNWEWTLFIAVEAVVILIGVLMAIVLGGNLKFLLGGRM